VRSRKGALNKGLASHSRDIIRDAFKVSQFCKINLEHAKQSRNSAIHNDNGAEDKG
jgi:hypothetical protein